MTEIHCHGAAVHEIMMIILRRLNNKITEANIDTYIIIVTQILIQYIMRVLLYWLLRTIATRIKWQMTSI